MNIGRTVGVVVLGTSVGIATAGTAGDGDGVAADTAGDGDGVAAGASSSGLLLGAPLCRSTGVLAPNCCPHCHELCSEIIFYGICKSAFYLFYSMCTSFRLIFHSTFLPSFFS